MLSLRVVPLQVKAASQVARSVGLERQRVAASRVSAMAVQVCTTPAPTQQQHITCALN